MDNPAAPGPCYGCGQDVCQVFRPLDGQLGLCTVCVRGAAGRMQQRQAQRSPGPATDALVVGAAGVPPTFASCLPRVRFLVVSSRRGFGAYVRTLTQLRFLYVDFSTLTDSELQLLETLTELRELGVPARHQRGDTAAVGTDTAAEALHRGL